MNLYVIQVCFYMNVVCYNILFMKSSVTKHFIVILSYLYSYVSKSMVVFYGPLTVLRSFQAFNIILGMVNYPNHTVPWQEASSLPVFCAQMTLN